MATIRIKSRSGEKKGDSRDEMRDARCEMRDARCEERGARDEVRGTRYKGRVIVGVTLAWRVLHSAPSQKIIKEPTNSTVQLKTDS